MIGNFKQDDQGNPFFDSQVFKDIKIQDPANKQNKGHHQQQPKQQQQEPLFKTAHSTC